MSHINLSIYSFAWGQHRPPLHECSVMMNNFVIYRVNWMALFGCRELIKIGGGFKPLPVECRNHVARLEYGYGTSLSRNEAKW